MYHFLEDKKFEKKMRGLCGKIMQNLCHNLSCNYDIGANFYLVGSGARNMIMQNENEPVDLDYNLEINKCNDFNDCKKLKENVIKAFNEVLYDYELDNCEDSRSAVTTQKRYFTKGNPTEFSMDVCIVTRNNQGDYLPLIHKKTGFVFADEYFWNKAPNSAKTKKKADYIKSCGLWNEVREEYKAIKNYYLSIRDNNHPSFICYVEAVNNVYNRL